jgi:acyl-CoA reductase-like NAD-dependent aldehyde dehydrogenase
VSSLPAEAPERPDPPPATGDQAVDAAVAALAEVAGHPVEERLRILEHVHRTLQDRLADVEE